MTFKTGLLRALAVAFAVAASPAPAEEISHYQSLLTPLLETGTDIIDQPIVYPSGTPKVTSAIAVIPPGEATGWHTHEVPLLVHVLDGTVTVEESRLPGAKDHIVVSTSHTGMLFSAEVADQAAHFLQHGSFSS